MIVAACRLTKSPEEENLLREAMKVDQVLDHGYMIYFPCDASSATTIIIINSIGFLWKDAFFLFLPLSQLGFVRDPIWQLFFFLIVRLVSYHLYVHPFYRPFYFVLF